MHYLAVIGSREFNKKELLFEILDAYISTLFGGPVTLVSGGARGADTLAEVYAKKHNLNIIIYEPDWSIGRHAGFVRNRQIIEKADHVIACLVGNLPCRGTKNSLSIAAELGKETTILNMNL